MGWVRQEEARGWQPGSREIMARSRVRNRTDLLLARRSAERVWGNPSPGRCQSVLVCRGMIDTQTVRTCLCSCPGNRFVVHDIFSRTFPAGLASRRVEPHNLQHTSILPLCVLYGWLSHINQCDFEKQTLFSTCLHLHTQQLGGPTVVHTHTQTHTLTHSHSHTHTHTHTVLYK